MALVLIGSNGSGKSTLGNFLQDPDNLHPDEHFEVSTDNLPKTSRTEIKTVQVTFTCTDGSDSNTVLQQEDSVSASSVAATALPAATDTTDPPCEEESDTGCDSTGGDYSTDERQKEIALTVIDTPGLNEVDPKKDLEHMIELGRVLQHEGSVQACIFVVKFNSRLDKQYRDTIKYFSRFRPSLFSLNSIIVMTDFPTDATSIKRRKKQGTRVDQIISNAKKEIKESAGLCYDPIIFALDCCPLDAEETTKAKAIRDAILSCAFSQTAIDTKEIKVAKTDALISKDEEFIKICREAIEKFNTMPNAIAKAVLTSVKEMEEEIFVLKHETDALRATLEQRDTKTPVAAAVWSVGDMFKFFQWQSERFQVVSNWKITKVSKWSNGHSYWKDMVEEEKRVSGLLQGKFMRGLYARVVLETTQDIMYADEITTLKRKIAQNETEQAEQEVKLQKILDTNSAEQEGLLQSLQAIVAEQYQRMENRTGPVMTLDQAQKRLQEI